MKLPFRVGFLLPLLMFLVGCRLASHAHAQAPQIAAAAPGPAAADTAPAKTTTPQSAAANEGEPLPKWLKFDLYLRGRLEREMGFKQTKGDDDTCYMHRLRLGFRVEPTPWLRFYVQAQDTQVPGFSRGTAPASLADTMDLHQGYIELGGEKHPWTATVGRQQLTFGENRLIGFSDWTNSGRTFDAARLVYRGPGYRLDWFAAALVVQLQPRFDHPQLKNGLYGFYASFDRLIRRATVAPYVFWKINSGAHGELGSLGTQDRRTWGVRSAGLLAGKTTYSVEVALQTGHWAADRILAWAGHWNVTTPLPVRVWSPRLLLEFNHASGDANAKDGRRGTFDTLFPNNHDKYGLMDRFTWRNLNDAMTAVEMKPIDGWKVKTAFHYFWLANKNDGVYSTSTLIAQAKNATSSRLGPEFDLQASHALTRHLDVGVGFGHLWAGSYLRQATKYTGSTYPFLTWTYRI